MSNTVTEQDVDDLLIHLNIHYDEDTIALAPADYDILLDALETYKEKIVK